LPFVRNLSWLAAHETRPTPKDTLVYQLRDILLPLLYGLMGKKPQFLGTLAQHQAGQSTNRLPTQSERKWHEICRTERRCPFYNCSQRQARYKTDRFGALLEGGSRQAGLSGVNLGNDADGDAGLHISNCSSACSTRADSHRHRSNFYKRGFGMRARVENGIGASAWLLTTALLVGGGFGPEVAHAQQFPCAPTCSQFEPGGDPDPCDACAVDGYPCNEYIPANECTEAWCEGSGPDGITSDGIIVSLGDTAVFSLGTPGTVGAIAFCDINKVYGNDAEPQPPSSRMLEHLKKNIPYPVSTECSKRGDCDPCPG
jgi:hypothetical protein